jgi:glucuronokinase
VIVPKFRAEVVLYEWPTIEIVWSQEDQSRFRTIHELVHDVELHGYYGGVRLVKATIRKFVNYCDRQGIALHNGTFSIRYQSNIPRQVGLAGSSAIIIATLRALMQFYAVEIPEDVQPSLALSVEKDELHISAGLQDRVIQVYEGLVSMDFARDRMYEKHGFQCGVYERLDPALLPTLYVACNAAAGEPTEVTHGPLRARFERKDPDVLKAMATFADLTVRAREALVRCDAAELSRLMDANFDLRKKIMDLSPGHVRMVETARKCGASAKFAGSGGAILGIYQGEAMWQALRRDLEAIGCTVFKLNGVAPRPSGP